MYPLDTVKTRIQALSPPSASAPAHPAITPSSDEEKSRLAQREKRHHGLSPVALTRLLLRKLRKWEMLAMLVRIIRTEGVTGAFKGFSANMINTFSQRKLIVSLGR